MRAVFSPFVDRGLLSTSVFCPLLLCLLRPQAVGLNVDDNDTRAYLPIAMERMCATLEQSLSDANLFQFSSALSELLSVQSMDLFVLDLLDSVMDTVGASIFVRGFRTLFRAAPRTLSSCLDSERGNISLLAERLGVAVCQLPDNFTTWEQCFTACICTWMANCRP